MAVVTCKYCGKKFNREKEPYIQIPAGTRFRYGHSQCYLDAVNNGKEKEFYEIYDPKKFVNCFWCSKAILPTDEDVIELPDMFGRYAHKKCAEEHPKDDREKMIVYIIQLYKFKDDMTWPRLLQQAETIAKDYKFTYSGMMKALEYFYKVKGNPIDKTKGIGIIPYTYKQAYDYYYHLWLAQEQNKQKDLNEYIPKDIVITIKSPQRQIEKRPLFNFLDNEEEESK